MGTFASLSASQGQQDNSKLAGFPEAALQIEEQKGAVFFLKSPAGTRGPTGRSRRDRRV